MLGAKKIRIGTRGSNLALAQAHEIKDLLLKSNPNYRQSPDLISVTTFKTTGDNILDRSLSEIGGKGLFTKEIEEALLAKEIDIAVHSMKDMPANCPAGLDIFAIPKREDSRDAFISKKYNSISELPKRAIVGTSSSRRKALLLKIRPDLTVVNFRGNVNSRLAKIDRGEVDATILAVAGLKRINMENYISSIIATEEILPAVAQGAIGVQCRAGDDFIIRLVKQIDDSLSNLVVTAERAFLKVIDGSCKTPMAANCQIKDNLLHLKALICRPDGAEIYETYQIGNLNEAEKIGVAAGLEIVKNAKHILDSLK